MKGNSQAPTSRRPSIALAIGFIITATLTYAGVWFTGAGFLADVRGTPAAWIIAGVGSILLLLADLGFAGMRTPSWRRQTPQSFMHRYSAARAAFYWGLDAGLVVTTFRFTSLSWVALTFALLGLVPPWAGVVYALGFVLPELASQLILPRRTDPSGKTDPEPLWVMSVLLRIRPRIHRVGVAVLGAAAIWSAVVPLFGGG